MKNWYWRKDSFEGLKRVGEMSRSNSDWALYTQYCELKEKGLRKQAFKALDEFIENINKLPLGKKIEFTNWIEERRLKNHEVIDLIPNPLQRKLIEPTLKEWAIAEPNNPIPLRWINSKESLMKAIELDDQEQISRYRLFRLIIGWIDHNQHELQEYLYIGNPKFDLEMLQMLKGYVMGIEDSNEIVEAVEARIEICEAYIQFDKIENLGSGEFIPFMKKSNPNFNFEKYL